MMNKVVAQILKRENIGSIPGPWWLLQLWLNLYMYKFAKPDLTNLPFPSTNYAEKSKAITRGCSNHGEAASALKINKLLQRQIFPDFL